MAEATRTRDTRVDTSTGVLIILVVYGHVLATMQGPAAHAALFWLYIFHIPAFVFVSGYVTRFARSWSPVTIITRLFFPYVVFALVQRSLVALWSGKDFDLKPLSVPWTLWYLLALMAWRLAVPLVRRMSFGVGVAVATALSIAGAGLSFIGPAYSLGRIVGFFPFFVAGLLWRDEWWQWLLSTRVRLVAGAVLAASAIWAIPFHRVIPRAEFLFSQSYDDLELGPGEGMAHRAVILVIAAVLALSVISLTMRSVPALATIGVASLSVYLLHAVVLFPWHEDGAPSSFVGAWATIAALVLSIALAWLLSRRAVVRATRPLMDLRWWQDLVSRRKRTPHATP